MEIKEIRINMNIHEKNKSTWVKISKKYEHSTLCNEHYMTKFCQHEYYVSKNMLVPCNVSNCQIARRNEFVEEEIIINN